MFAWQVACVTKLITSSDGYIRIIEAVNGKGSTLRRTITSCYPLELAFDFEHAAIPSDADRPTRAMKTVHFTNPLTSVPDSLRKSDRLKSKLPLFKSFVKTSYFSIIKRLKGLTKSFS